MSGILLAAVGLLVLASAMLSAAESAIFAVSPSRLRTLREEGFHRAETLFQVREELPGVRAALLAANTILNIFIVGLLTMEATAAFGAMGAAVAIGGSTLLVLALGEALPRFVGLRQPIRIALLSAPTVGLLTEAVRPVLSPFHMLDDLLRPSNGELSPGANERELLELTELGRVQGVVGEDEHRLVERAFRMDELRAWDIMTPRVDIFAWPDSLTLEEAIPQLGEVPHSRIPVFGQSIDDITGVLYVRQAYEAYVAGHGSMRLSELAREPFFVPGSLTLPRLLRDFQLRRLHMSIVADEFGGTDGLVTLEDVIEELVGEIEDETDIQETPIRRTSRTEAEVDGAVELREVNHALNVSLPHLEARSLNGYLLEHLGRVPEAGDEIQLPGLSVEILEATETQVIRARLRKTQPLQPGNVE
jgi:putative hemolysin